MFPPCSCFGFCQESLPACYRRGNSRVRSRHRGEKLSVWKGAQCGNNLSVAVYVTASKLTLCSNGYCAD